MTENVYRIDLAAAHEQQPADGWWGSVTQMGPDEALLDARDLGASRGDGIFETFGTMEGRVHALGAHLARLGRSAHSLDLPEPNVEQLNAVVRRAAQEIDAPGQASIKLVLTRGVEGTGIPTGWMVVTAISADAFASQRRDGIDVVVLERGYPSDVAGRAPWLLAGAKTLSYAVNMAALREAKRQGADEALFVSTDGYALEAPTSNLVVKLDGEFVTTPPVNGILAGTTQGDLFELLEGWGERTAYRLLTIDEVRSADAAWLLSSVRLAAPLRSLDGQPLEVDVELTARINDALLGR
ncbi:aminodeoxychorismate lyase [Okibacterium fritillariae]|uniref:aminodeoxychorismate lyase n=1 Tax=Okibacterium fritillariae TaxID=123320 RepID=UPI00405544B2